MDSFLDFQMFFAFPILYTSISDVGGRSRRDAPKTIDKNLQNVLSSLETLTDFVQKQSNQTFQREINQALEKFFTNLPSKELCKRFLTQCCCKGVTLYLTPLSHSPTRIFLLVCSDKNSIEIVIIFFGLI